MKIWTLYPKNKNPSYVPDRRYGAHAILSPPHGSSSVSVHAQSALACEDKKYIPTLLRSTVQCVHMGVRSCR